MTPMTPMRLHDRVTELRRARTPFVHATVVRAQQPTSAHPGDEAILLPDGTIEGFVGGHCAQNSVRQAALGALQVGQSVLLRVLPDGDVSFPETPGACVVVNHCLSGGALEIFLDPQVPAPLVGVFGGSPIADALVEVTAVLGYDVRRLDAPDPSALDGASALVIASLGGPEADLIRARSTQASATSAWSRAGAADRRSWTGSTSPSPSAPGCTPRSASTSGRGRQPRSRCRSRPR